MSDERACWYAAADCLDTALREVEFAADALSGLAGEEFFAALDRARTAIDEAKREIGVER